MQRSKRKVLPRGLSENERTALGHLLFPFMVELLVDDDKQYVDYYDIVVTRRRRDRAENKPQIIIPETTAHPIQDRLSNGNGIVTLPFDILSLFNTKLESALNPKISLKYQLSTGLPFKYNVLPSGLRSRLLALQKKGQLSEGNFDLSRHLSVENARALLIRGFEALELPLERKHPPTLYLTHDVDSSKGLGRALRMKTAEDSLGVRSTWFLVSHEYKIKEELARDLANGSEIGSHDVRHDGKLISIGNFEALVQRLKASKERLEEIANCNVTSFRSPLLQFNKKIISALDAAGYETDFSLPCWEPIHPSTMASFGLEAAQPLNLGGIIEHPLSMYQDHQAFNILNLNTTEAAKLWLDQAELLFSLGCDIVLLIHPDYAFGEDVSAYKELISSLLKFQKTSLASLEVNIS